MPRHFTAASSEFVDCSLGAGGSLSGAASWAVILKRSSNSGGAAKFIFAIGTTNATLRGLTCTAADQVNYRSNNTASGSATITCTTTDGWVCLVGTKAAGSSVPRIHKYVYSSNTWTHANAAIAVTDSTPTGGVQLGHGVGSFIDGDIAIVGTWAAALTDAQVESLAFSLPAWYQIAPNGLWILDQSSTSMLVNDQTGNGANQSGITGTSVGTSNVPVFSYGAPIDVTRTFPDTRTGTSSTTNANDTSSASGAPGASGTSATTNANDTSTASGTASGPAATAATVGSGRPANARALADAQGRRDKLLREDEEILILI